MTTPTAPNLPTLAVETRHHTAPGRVSGDSPTVPGTASWPGTVGTPRITRGVR